jgi:membrane-bound ClpP family serine protease
MEYWIWAILLLAAGTGLALAEVFFPSAGILGFLSLVALVGAVVMGFYQHALLGAVMLVAVIIGLPVLIVLSFRYWPKTKMGQRVLLGPPSSADVLPVEPDKERLRALIGRVGHAKSKLLLSGVVTIDSQTVDAVSESMPVEVGQAVRVIQVRGLRVVVRPVADGETPPPPADPLKQDYEDPFERPHLDSKRPGGDVG